MHRVLCCVVVALAFSIGLAQGWPAYSFEVKQITPLPGPNVLQVSCRPYLTEGGEGYLTFMCEARSLEGNPAFYPTLMNYVVDGWQYTVQSDEYQFLASMEPGTLIEGAGVTFRWHPRFMSESEPLGVYYGGQGIIIPLPELLTGD